MKTVLKIFCSVLLLASCAGLDSQKESDVQAVQVRLSLTDKVQELVVKTQQTVTSALPDEIEGLKSSESVADREKNQRGAGFTKVYTHDDAVVTVFVYNNQEFGISDEVSPVMEMLMDKHLQEFQSMQDSGLYEGVKAGNKKPREFRWRGVKYQVLEAEVQFSQRGEAKKSFLVLGANKDLMSYIRIRYTYPKSRQTEFTKKQPVFTRTVFVAMNGFAQAQKTPAAE